MSEFLDFGRIDTLKVHKLCSAETSSLGNRRLFVSTKKRVIRSNVVVSSPPEKYNFRDELQEKTRLHIVKNYPELFDLIEDGSLIVVERPSDYVERRSDGYTEPEFVYIIGTSHVSTKSAADVSRVIEVVRPANVVVELCRSRAGTMYRNPNSSEEGGKGILAISGESFSQTMMRTLTLGGRSALGLRLVLSTLSHRLSRSSGVQSGVEFKAARESAEAVGSQLVLGDRPIEITLQRGWKALSFPEKWKLLWFLAQSIGSSQLDVEPEVLEKMKSDDMLSAMFASFSASFPSLVAPLIHERDVYLAWSMKRSKAVNGCHAVVGVVGKGHLRGVAYALTHNQENLRFRDLVGARGEKRKKEELLKFIRNLFVELGIGWIAFTLFTELTSS